MINTSQVLDEKKHAVLFGLLSRVVITRFGEQDGTKAIRLAVRRYGEQRGHRMALRAIQDGESLTLKTFLQYSEWQAETNEGVSSVVANQPDLVNRVHQCPWNNAWQETGLLPYGRLYCLEIDHALVRGFNPDLYIHVNQTLSNEGNYCEFVYPKTPSTGEKASAERRVMPWDYHCAHLYSACQTVFGEQQGEQGHMVAQQALNEFGTLYGVEVVNQILGYLDTDFSQLSKPKHG